MSEPQYASRGNIQAVQAGTDPPEKTLAGVLNARDGQGGTTLRRFIGRQPILDADYRVIGYELKVKSDAPFPPGSGTDASQRLHDEVLMVGLIDLAFQSALGNKLTFIALAPETLNNPLLDEVPAGLVVVAINPGHYDPEALLERCLALSHRGIQIALDDFEFRPELAPLLAIAHYLRFDTASQDALQLSSRVLELLTHKKLPLIARRVETEQDFEAYRKLPFSMFQGYYFAQPRPAPTQRLDSSRLRVMELLNMVMNHAEIRDMEQKIKLDPALSYRLLTYINSPANGLRHPIRSIAHCLTLLGYDQLYRWLTLLLFTTGTVDGRSQALLKNALVRGRFAEILASVKLPPDKQGELFITGVFSLLDVLLNVPMEQAIGRLNLSQPVLDALLRKDGIYAPYVQLAAACENFDQGAVAELSAEIGMKADDVNLAHVKALIWSEQVEI